MPLGTAAFISLAIGAVSLAVLAQGRGAGGRERQLVLEPAARWRIGEGGGQGAKTSS
jgi:hypothetical protein